MEKLKTKTYKNSFVNHFEGDESGQKIPRQTPGVFYSKASPTPVKAPRLLAWSEALAAELGIAKPDHEEVEILGGNALAPGMQPYAACYGGHQFGNWAGQLGDGRAITLAEWPRADGKAWELQLKGAGPTPYSRRADGRAVLRSSVREYLMSEAMHYLGVPTTRALSLVATGDQIMRDMFYNGNPALEPGAIVMRVAPSFLRFGNYEIFAAREEHVNLEKLVHWTIDQHYPHLQGEDRILRWYGEVVERTAALMVEWIRVGFVHGVMNTDNMSILGLTIDYGPYSFVDDYDPDFTPNTTDLPGRRYAFGKQAAVAKWNLGCLGGAIAPLFEGTDALVETLETYDALFTAKYKAMMAGKLGLDEVRESDTGLFTRFEQTLSLISPDMTIFYQLLISLPEEVGGEQEVLSYFEDSYYEQPNAEKSKALHSLIQEYRKRIKTNTISREASKQRMRKSNPRFILRNYLLHQAIEGLEKNDDALFRKLEEAMKEPYSSRHDEFFAKRPDWAGKKAGCSMLSCSS